MKMKHALLSYTRLSCVGLLLLFSLFSKETGILFAFVLLLYGWLCDRINFKRIAVTVCITMVIYIFFRATASLSAFMYNMFPTIVQRTPLSVRLLTLPKILFYYISTFFLPIHLAVGQEWLVRQADIPHFFLPLIFDLLVFICLITSGVIIYKKRNKLFKSYIFFVVWFIVGLGMHAQIVPLDLTVADRYFYFPIIGLLGLLGVVVNCFNKKIINSHSSRFFIIGFCFLVVLLSLLTIIRNSQW